MSSSSSTMAGEEMSSLIASLNCENAAFTMLVYDWFLCLDEEISLIWSWKARRTVAPLIYVLARYMPIACNAFIVASSFPMSFLSCKTVVWVQEISDALSLMAPPIFSAIRAYALSGGNVYLAMTTFILSIVPMINDMIIYFRFQSILVLPSPYNCSGIDHTPQQLEDKLTMITRACALSADLLVVAITWFYTYKIYKIQKSLKLRSSLAGIMLSDGSLYFVILASLRILQMILAVLQINGLDLTTGNYVTIFLEPISYVLICHFLLNLRLVDRKTADPSLQSNQDGDLSVRFARHSMSTLPAFVGSLEEPVHTGSAIDSDLNFEGDSSNLVQNESADPDAEIVEVSSV